MITSKEFELEYGLDLLPKSLASFAVGDIWDWERKNLLSGWILQYQADNIADLLNLPNLKKDLEKIKKVDAMLPEIDMTKAIKLDSGIDIPSINLKISNNLSVESITKISFGNLKAKSIKDYKNKIRTELNTFKESNWQIYKQHIRLKEIAIELFYADEVTIEIDRNINNETAIEVLIAQAELEVSNKLIVENKVTLKIKTKNCPFAVQTIKGKDF